MIGLNKEARLWKGGLLLGAALLLALSTWGTPSAHSKDKPKHDDRALQGLDCSACHTTEGWALSDRAGQKGGFNHAKTGFPLTGEHERVICTGCHQPKVSVSRDCFSCHKDKHRGRLGLQCDSCHNSKSWQQTRAIKRHRLTRLPLTGTHAVLDCTSCHLRRSDRQYRPVPADCFACHEADYRGDIHPPHQGDATSGQAPFSRVCSQCHQTSGWSPAFINPNTQLLQTERRALQHDRVFVLSSGPHRRAQCSSCHPIASAPKMTACNGCHAHSAAALRKQHGRRVPSTAMSCITCHPRGRLR